MNSSKQHSNLNEPRDITNELSSENKENAFSDETCYQIMQSIMTKENIKPGEYIGSERLEEIVERWANEQTENF